MWELSKNTFLGEGHTGTFYFSMWLKKKQKIKIKLACSHACSRFLVGWKAEGSTAEQGSEAQNGFRTKGSGSRQSPMVCGGVDKNIPVLTVRKGGSLGDWERARSHRACHLQEERCGHQFCFTSDNKQMPVLTDQPQQPLFWSLWSSIWPWRIG